MNFMPKKEKSLWQILRILWQKAQNPLKIKWI